MDTHWFDSPGGLSLQLRASKLYFGNNTHIVCEANCQSKYKNAKMLLVSTPINISSKVMKYFQMIERHSEVFVR